MRPSNSDKRISSLAATLLLASCLAAVNLDVVQAQQQCGPSNGGVRCGNSLCCSQYGWCGNSPLHCGVGCLSAFGSCSGSRPVPPPANPGQLPISLNGQCGAGLAQCPSGQCCSQYGWCGVSVDHCNSGCQIGLGTCNGVSPPPSPPPSPTPSPPPSGGGASISGNVVSQCIQPGMFALTIDDGPNRLTGNFLSELNRQSVRATFFVIGVNIANNPSLTRLIYNAGHQIGAHSYSHPSFTSQSDAQIRREMALTDTLIRREIGVSPRYFRYPYGSNNARTNSVVTSLGYHKIQWSIDSRDWDTRNTDSIVSAVRSAIDRSNSATSSHIALFHEFVDQTIPALQTLIPYIRSRGYRFVTMAECLGDNAPYR